MLSDYRIKQYHNNMEYNRGTVSSIRSSSHIIILILLLHPDRNWISVSYIVGVHFIISVTFFQKVMATQLPGSSIIARVASRVILGAITYIIEWIPSVLK